MNRLLAAASRSTAATLRINRAAATSTSSTPASFRFVSARCFSDDAAIDPNDAAIDPDEIKAGTMQTFSADKGYGFVVPDGVDKENHKKSDNIFVHRSAFKHFHGPDRFYPILQKGQRIQFKVEPPPDGKEASRLRAREVTLEGGKLIPPFSDNYLDRFTKSKKARFGMEVFDIFGTSKDQTELETRIVEAYDKTKNEIERQRERVEKAMAVGDEHSGDAKGE